MFDLIAVGEILVDLIEEGSLQFSGTVGGAPCNALAQAAKLGSRTAFIGMVGDDAFGRACALQLDGLGIDRAHLYITGQADTTLAFVTLDENGDRHFTFYRRPGADTLLTVKHIPFDLIAQSRVYLFGGVSLSKDPARAAVFYSLFKLSGAPVLKAFDPNLRPALWEDLEEAKALGRKAMGLCDILKLSDEEAVFFSGHQNPLEGARALQEEFQIPLVLMSMGARGCAILLDGDCCHLDACPVQAVDTTAAGDSFFGAFLHRLLKNPFKKLEELSPSQIVEAAQFATAAASVTVSRKGSIPALPTGEEVQALLGPDEA
ncbi:MAG: carbohydrate kinase [Oscillospiraceae bacterium]|nr:carbohydrate kinase [Oscillospiraceae bacterium]